jgi:hypothetical protein
VLVNGNATPCDCIYISQAAVDAHQARPGLPPRFNSKDFSEFSSISILAPKLMFRTFLVCLQQLPTQAGWFVEVPDDDVPFSVRFALNGGRYPLSADVLVDGQTAASCTTHARTHARKHVWLGCLTHQS